MDVVTGTDALDATPQVERLLAGIRRLSVLSEGAADTETIVRALARELMNVPGAEEVHVHRLALHGAADDMVAVYVLGSDGRIGYLVPRGERPPGVSWVARTGRSFLAAAGDELTASLPRLAQSGALSCAMLPLSERGEVDAVIVLVRRSSRAFSPPELELAGTLVDQAATGLALVRARAEAGTDAVTGAMNHRAMRRRLNEEIGRAMRTGVALSCMLIDLDNFKLVNDERGHQAGDAVLRGVVEALVGEFRAFDRVARYGGDEFVVILPNADLESAAAAASRALERLHSLPEIENGDATVVAASIGVAQWHSPMGTDELLEACDAALLRAKRQGKGRVTRAAQPIG